MPKKNDLSRHPDERLWIQQARQGDKEAYRKLVDHYKDRLYGLIFSMVRKREQAEDLTQEVFVKTYFALDRFEGESTFYTWLFRIATNHCLDFLRKHQPVQVSLDSPIDEESEISKVQILEAPHAERPEASLEDQSEVASLLADIDPEQRALLTLREFEGYSYEEIAAIMKCGINTIKSRLNRAREAFKQAYYRKFGTGKGNISEVRFVKEKEEKL